MLSLASFFNILALSRTLSNSVETTLTTAALCFWPWHANVTYAYAQTYPSTFSSITKCIHSRRLQIAFILAAASCLVRPTSAIMWALLFVELFWRIRSNRKFLGTLMTVCFTTA